MTRRFAFLLSLFLTFTIGYADENLCAAQPAVSATPHSGETLAVVQRSAAANSNGPVPGSQASSSLSADQASTVNPRGPAFQRGTSAQQRRMLAWIEQRVRESKKLAKGAATPQPGAATAGNNFAVPNFGGFLNGVSYPASVESACAKAPDNCGLSILLTGDLNGDGKPDLVAIQRDGVLYALLNDGSGGFKPPVEYAEPAPAPVRIMGDAISGDFNGDGRMDVAEVDTANNAIVVYLSKGDGTFLPPTVLPVATPDSETLQAVAVGDVNGDKKPDLVALSSIATGGVSFGPPAPPGGGASTTFTMQTFMGNGDGTFATPKQGQTTVNTISGGAATFGINMQLADVLHTGKPALVFVLGEPSPNFFFNTICAAVAPGNGDGTFGAYTTPIQGGYGIAAGAQVQLVDLNDDGNLDIATTSSTGMLSALSDGQGGFLPQVAGGAGPQDLLFADLNGDGYPDLMDDRGGTSFLPGNGDGTFGAAIATYSIQNIAYTSAVLADFNGDGIPDLAELGNGPFSIVLYTGEGGGKFSAPHLLSSKANPVIDPNSLALQVTADFNGDGNTDVLAVELNAPASLVTALSDGKGGFSYKTALDQSQFLTLDYVQPITADFNGDGLQDIILTGSGGTLGIALSNGDGTFGTPIRIEMGALACELGYAATADLTGSGHPDLVIPYGGDASCGSNGPNPSGYYVIPNHGKGVFGTPQFFPFGYELSSITLADLNGDHVPDIVLNDSPINLQGATFAVYYLPGNGDGTFGESRTINYGNVITQVIAADVNGDGKTDLVMFSEGAAGNVIPGLADETAGIYVYANHGDGAFDVLPELGAGNFFVSGYVGDVNGDGIPDITASLYESEVPDYLENEQFDGLATWLGLGQGYFSPVSTAVPRAAAATLPGHFLSDGTVSFAIGFPYNSSVAIMLNQGGDSLSLTPSATSAPQGAGVDLSAAISTTFAHGSATGTVSFAANGVALGSAPVNNGIATLSTSSLPLGANTVSATYSGDSHYNVALASTAVTVTAIQPAVAVNASPTSLALTAGETGTAVISVAANATFNGTVTFACSGAPAQSTCTVSPASLQLSGGQTGTVTAVVATTAPNNTYQAGNTSGGPGSPSLKGGGLLALACLVILPWRRRISRGFLILLMAFGVSAAGIVGCSGSGSSSKAGPAYSGTAAGSYTLTVTATAGSITSSSTITLQVQ